MQPSVPEDIMHPMFVKLFMQTDDDDLLYKQGRRRRAPRSRRALTAMAVRAAVRDRQQTGSRYRYGSPEGTQPGPTPSSR